MNIHSELRPRAARHGRVIALHCSGAGAGQWRNLAGMLDGYEVLAPEHYGTDSAGPWTGRHAFTLADEAVRAIELIDMSQDKVHLAGHSYGGGGALHVAMARPDRIASMALYEPSAFHLLHQMGIAGAKAYAEIGEVARRLSEAVLAGDHRGGVAGFFDYWNEVGAWNAAKPEVRDFLTRWAPKGPLDFRALFQETTRADAYRALKFPVLILRGERAPAPTRAIAEFLHELLPDSRLIVLGGAGHMGPLTHASEVADLMSRHIVAASARNGRIAVNLRPPVYAAAV